MILMLQMIGYFIDIWGMVNNFMMVNYLNVISTINILILNDTFSSGFSLAGVISIDVQSG
jgi:hypothetical protein